MRKRVAVLVVGLVLLAACDGTADGGARDARAASPSPARPEAPVRMSLYTHCGVVGATVDGVTWVATPRLGDGNPPSGWGNPYTAGRWQRTGEATATFTSDAGSTATFVPAEPAERLPPCW